MKKNIIKKTAGAMLLLSVGFTSCTDSFDNINSNPHGVNPEEIPVATRFLQPQHAIYMNYQNSDFEYQLQQNLNADLYSGYMANPTDFGANYANHTYVMNEGWNNMPFKVGIGDVMKPISEILEITEEVDFIAIAKIIRVAAMHRVTDIYGPVPYSKTMQGGSTVEYDSQQAVYDAFFVELAESINGLTQFLEVGEATTGRLSFDNMCQQSHIQWIKFANTLRLRLAMRIVKVDEGKAKTEAEAAVNQKYGVLTATDKNIEVVNKTLLNPLRTIVVDYNDMCVGASYESIMKGYADPRLSKQILPVGWNGEDIHDSNGDPLGLIGQFHGIRQGALVKKSDYKMFSIVNFEVESNDKSTTKYPLPIMKVAEAYFLRAEGALRGWNMGGTAQALYEEGIQVSFNEYEIPAAEYANYIADNESMAADYVDPFNAINNISGANNVTIQWTDAVSNEEKLQKIITQKWIAMFPEGQEAWSEFRRTGYPKLFPVANNFSSSNNGGVIPAGEFIKRLTFTQDERNSNKEAVEKAVTLLNGEDKINTRVWWDVAKGNF
jgi:hypothetical protein